MALYRCSSGGSSQAPNYTQFQYGKIFTASTSTKPSISISGQTNVPTKVFLVYSSNVITNVNPTTQEVETTKTYLSIGGGAWTERATAMLTTASSIKWDAILSSTGSTTGTFLWSYD